MKFVIVVVLDDGEAELARQIEKPQAPLRRQRHRGRELMMRREIERAHFVLAAKPLDIGDIQSVVVELGADDSGAGGAERLPGGRVAQRFHQHGFAGPQQNPRREKNRHLAAAGDADIVGIGDEAAMRHQHIGDGLAQDRRAARIAVAQPIAADRLPQRRAVGARQHVRRQQPRIGRAVVESQLRALDKSGQRIGRGTDLELGRCGLGAGVGRAGSAPAAARAPAANWIRSFLACRRRRASPARSSRHRR